MLKRTLAIAGTAAIIALAIAPSASASNLNGVGKLGPFGAGATAQALQLTLLGKDIAVSTTSAAADSKPEAKADGAALLLAGTPVPGAAPSAAPGGPASNKTCAADVN